MTTQASQNPLAGLRQFARNRRAPAERCELCGQDLPPEHDHLVEPATRRIACACGACAMLFDAQASARFRRVPRTVEFLTDFQITDAEWDALSLPINLAFFFYSSPAKRVIALFPSPAGATESLLPLTAWQDLLAANPVLADFKPDVEALLVNRIGSVRESFRVPIDECFKLVGLIRTHWHGLSGGVAVWEQLALFTAGLKDRSTSVTEGTKGTARTAGTPETGSATSAIRNPQSHILPPPGTQNA